MFNKIYAVSIGLLLATSTLISNPASAERLFGEQIEGKSKNMGDLAAEVQFRSRGDGNRLIAELGGITRDSHLLGPCVPDLEEEEIDVVCRLLSPLRVVVRAKNSNGGKEKLVQRTREVVFLNPPELPTQTDVDNVVNCKTQVGDVSIIDETCTALEPVEEYCLHVGTGGAAEVQWRPIPRALHDAVMAKPRSARAFITTKDRTNNLLIKSVNKLTADHPPLTLEEAQATVENARSSGASALGIQACENFAALVESTVPVDADIEAVLDAQEEEQQGP